jgi:hypothetical protein
VPDSPGRFAVPYASIPPPGGDGAGEQCRRDAESARECAVGWQLGLGRDLRAFGLADADVAEDLLLLLLGHGRSDVSGEVGAAADP